jgi:two-component system chemotaxis response regulator CheB
MFTPRKIRVLIVDDSAVVRRYASEALASDPEIEVVGTAEDPYVARDRLLELKPDVLTLDLEMPRMDGLTFLKLLMQSRPTPVIVMSSLTQRGSDYTLEALRLGAVDFLGKPGSPNSFGELGPQLIAKVKAAAAAKVRAYRPEGSAPPFARPTTSAKPPQVGTHHGHNPRSIILLGASTGGTEALRDVLTRLPANMPGIAIVQHIPGTFSKAFADRLNTLCELEVREAVDGDRVAPGLALIAPGGFHMMLQWSADHYRVRITGGPPIWHQRPAVDLLFKSAVDCGASPHAVAGILTGMGKDGAEGLLRLKEKGARTFAQDEASCVVYGMPKAAWECGAAQIQVPLERIAHHIIGRFEVAHHAETSAATLPS